METKPTITSNPRSHGSVSHARRSSTQDSRENSCFFLGEQNGPLLNLLVDSGVVEGECACPFFLSLNTNNIKLGTTTSAFAYHAAQRLIRCTPSSLLFHSCREEQFMTMYMYVAPGLESTCRIIHQV